MKQFYNIFKFECASYLKNKVFIGVTLAIVIGIGVVLCFPRIAALIKFDAASDPGKEKTMLLSDAVSGDPDALRDMLEDATGAEIELTGMGADDMTALVDQGAYSGAIHMVSPTKYTYIVKNTEMYDNAKNQIDGVLLERYRVQSMAALGVSPDLAGGILSAAVESELIQTGKDQMRNFLYTYILIVALYIAILLYGQFVATSVASEKSSRAMELLITSAKPSNLMFGKVLGAGAAGLLQIAVILGASFVFYSANKSLWGGNAAVNSLFNMPPSIMLYTILFFILGYFVYSFLYGAVGSLASKVEDINTSSMPITFLFIISFLIVVYSMTSGSMDSALMVVASYVPFTSPMAMFARIAMSDVAAYEIVISVAVLIASTAGIGFLSAKIYQVGVLMYGKPPKMSGIIKALMKG